MNKKSNKLLPLKSIFKNMFLTFVSLNCSYERSNWHFALSKDETKKRLSSSRIPHKLRRDFLSLSLFLSFPSSLFLSRALLSLANALSLRSSLSSSFHLSLSLISVFLSYKVLFFINIQKKLINIDCLMNT